MQFLKQNLINHFIVFLVFCFAVLLVSRGILNAKLAKQSQTTAANAQTVSQGMRFFFKDFERFPQALEYESASVMRDYFTQFPPKEFISSGCPQTWVYSRPTPENFELNFCLQKDAGDFARGWNKISGRADL